MEDASSFLGQLTQIAALSTAPVPWPNPLPSREEDPLQNLIFEMLRPGLEERLTDIERALSLYEPLLTHLT